MLLDSVKNLVIDCRCCVKTFDPLTFVTSNRSHSLPQKGAFFKNCTTPSTNAGSSWEEINDRFLITFRIFWKRKKTKLPQFLLEIGGKFIPLEGKGNNFVLPFCFSTGQNRTNRVDWVRLGSVIELKVISLKLFYYQTFFETWRN